MTTKKPKPVKPIKMWGTLTVSGRCLMWAGLRRTKAQVKRFWEEIGTEVDDRHIVRVEVRVIE